MSIQEPENRPKVGVGVCIIKDGKVLLGQRLNAHGDGSWCFPGGHLEFGESFAHCAQREVSEETGLKVSDIELITCTNDIFPKENKHYITVYMVANWRSGEPQVLEPEKMIRWEWFSWDKLPQPLFVPMQNLIKSGWRP